MKRSLLIHISCMQLLSFLTVVNSTWNCLSTTHHFICIFSNSLAYHPRCIHKWCHLTDFSSPPLHNPVSFSPQKTEYLLSYLSAMLLSRFNLLHLESQTIHLVRKILYKGKDHQIASKQLALETRRKTA